MKEKIQYTDELAAAIIARHGLSETTQKVWKTRGYIPTKYTDENYRPGTKASKADLVTQKRIMEVLSRDIINVNVLCDLAGIYRQKYNDIRRGKTESFSAEEVLALKKEIAKLRLQIINTFSVYSPAKLKDLVNYELLKTKVIIDLCTNNRLDYERLLRFAAGKINFDAINYSLVKDCYLKAAMLISI